MIRNKGIASMIVSTIAITVAFLSATICAAQQIFVPNLSNALGQTASGSNPLHVGIGTSSPAYTLDVNGSLNAGAYNINGMPLGVWESASPHLRYGAGRVGIGQAPAAGGAFPGALLHVVPADCREVGFRLQSDCDLSDPGLIANLFEIVTRNQFDEEVHALTIDRHGRVGVGTDKPGADFDIKGTLRLNGTVPLHGRVMAANADGEAQWLSLAALLDENACIAKPVTTLECQFTPICQYDALELGANGGERLYIGGRQGNVPIAWNAYPGDVDPPGEDHGCDNTQMRFRNSSDHAAKIIYEPWGKKMRFMFSSPDQAPSAGTTVNWIDGLTLHNSGAVGIGTLTYEPGFKLMVNGTIRAKEIVVETGWSDFVFADDYKLLSLDGVEAYIAEHKHLPGVPSAADVQARGLRLSEASTFMMQKIEELTLYMIELQKQNRALAERNSELEQRVTAIERQ